LRSSTVVFIPESNLAWEGQHQSKHLKKEFGNSLVVMKEDHNRVGVRMDANIKKVISISLKEKLSKSHIKLYKDLVSLSETQVLPNGETPRMIKGQLVDQLLNFCRIIRPSRDPLKAPTELYSGKSGYGYDDMVIATMLNLFMKRVFWEKQREYKDYY
jgi:hypothetical protein